MAGGEISQRGELDDEEIGREEVESQKIGELWRGQSVVNRPEKLNLNGM